MELTDVSLSDRCASGNPDGHAGGQSACDAEVGRFSRWRSDFGAWPPRAGAGGSPLFAHMIDQH